MRDNLPPSKARAIPVPAGRMVRLARLGSVATAITGRAALQAMGDLGRGTRPDLRSLVLTPRNLSSLADELARMRGAAMKIGQLLSMDAGEVLPQELADILARLRDDAHFMPPKQLKSVLAAQWGQHWLGQFAQFNVRPIAAASIGQVHRARLKDGRDLAIKIQYPGVRRSIDSDVANVGALVRLSGLLPKGFDIAPYLDEARAQLHEETDYAREGHHLATFAERLADDMRFDVPDFHADWSTRDVLAMSYVDGIPIEEVASEDQSTRDRVAAHVIDLLLQEVFDLHEMQSDPNFANYRFNPDTGRIVLLDFGATRALDPEVVDAYAALIRAGLEDDTDGLRTAGYRIGFLGDGVSPVHETCIVEMLKTSFAHLRAAELYDFADQSLSRDMQDKSLGLAREGYLPPPVPMDVLYLQRKFGGVFLLASRLKARVPLLHMMQDALATHEAKRAAR